MTQQKPDGGYAYPQSQHVGYIGVSEGGMSLRDYYAGQALNGLLSTNSHLYMNGEKKTFDENDFALMAWNIADAMIRARGE